MEMYSVESWGKLDPLVPVSFSKELLQCAVARGSLYSISVYQRYFR